MVRTRLEVFIRSCRLGSSMAAWSEVVLSAFLLQLLALPGEKGQLVIAGLATTYRPSVVIAGAATAFGGWTVLEILLGTALQGAAPAVYLDALTAGIFVVFAVWMLSEALRGAAAGDDATDGGLTGVDPENGVLEGAGVSSGVAGYLSSFSAMAVAEFGDKTQLITISLAVQYGAHPGIWIGEMLAIVPVSALTAVLSARTAEYLNVRWVLGAAAAMFLLFAADIGAEYLLGWSLLPL
jgi:putative Ca2+/H+ antiporter (TMEM165/GDT1 family)